MASLLAIIGVWFYATVYGLLVLCGILKNVITKGYGNQFHKKKREMPACVRDPDLGTHGFLRLEGLRIHYVAKGPEDKPLMLFVHGFPEFWYSWRKQMQEFSQDYRCVAIDMRGYGESDKPTGFRNYQMKYLMRDLELAIQALGYESCVLVGHDWGGLIAWTFARLFPERVDKLIVMNAPSFSILIKMLRSDKKQYKKQFKKSWYMFIFQLPILPEIMFGVKDFSIIDLLFGHKSKTMTEPLTNEEVDAYKYMLSQPGALSAPINFYRAAFRCGLIEHDLNYSMPVLLIWGMKDVALSQENPDLIQKEAPAITVKKLESCGHFVQLDDSDKVNEVMREWLSSLITK